MLLMHFKSTHILMKILLIISLLIPFVGSGLLIFSTIENNDLWLYGAILISIGSVLYFVHFFYAKSSIKKLIDPARGIKTKNDKEFIFMNIHFKREVFTRKNFSEYKTHYNNFYVQVDSKIKNPFI